MSSIRLCVAPPGKHCQCGFWALSSPLKCLAMAYRGGGLPPSHVLGLIVGWGTVAIHGSEGFRAQHASVTCLFTDWAGATPVPNLARGRLTRWSRRVLGHRLNRHREAGAEPDPRRLPALRGAARRYAVPLISLRGALGLGVLGEWGIPSRRIQEVEAWVAAAGMPAGDG
jgi:hypothetical protein